MKNTILFLFLLITSKTWSQSYEDLTKKNSRVFVEVNDERYKGLVTNYLNKSGYYNVSANVKESDFTIKCFFIDARNNYIGYATLLNSKSGDEISRTKNFYVNYKVPEYIVKMVINDGVLLPMKKRDKNNQK